LVDKLSAAELWKNENYLITLTPESPMANLPESGKKFRPQPEVGITTTEALSKLPRSLNGNFALNDIGVT
jgi:hypothetical protein